MQNLKPWHWLLAIVLVTGIGFSLYNFSGSDGQGLLRDRQNNVVVRGADINLIPTRQQLLDEKQTLINGHFVDGNLTFEKANQRMWLFELACVSDRGNAKQSFTNINNNYRDIYSYLRFNNRVINGVAQDLENKPLNQLTANDISLLRSYVDGVRLNYSMSNISNFVSDNCLSPQVIAASMPFVRVGLNGELEVIEARLTTIEAFINRLELYVNSRG